MKQSALQARKIRRAKRTRAKIFGTAACPRLAVFRSNRYVSVQLIDDEKGKTLISVSSLGLKHPKTKAAQAVGEAVAKKAAAAGIKKAVFDRRSYQYHGRVKAVAEGARAGGLKI